MSKAKTPERQVPFPTPDEAAKSSLTHWTEQIAALLGRGEHSVRLPAAVRPHVPALTARLAQSGWTLLTNVGMSGEYTIKSTRELELQREYERQVDAENERRDSHVRHERPSAKE